MKIEAFLYEKLKDKMVHCYLCSHHCRIPEEKFGFCGMRQNIGGVLYTYAFGKAIAAHIDPIEKKPLYHFFPGSASFSLASLGCNFRCSFCQNWEISQASAKARDFQGQSLAPEEIVELAVKNKCKSISYTYTEPTIFFEYAFKTAQLAREKGIYNNFVTNGYMTQECLIMAHPFLDAANVDLKFFKDSSYKKVCGGSLKPVLDSIRLMRSLGIWVEVTTLIIPGENDSEEELGQIAAFLSGVDKGMPWHISRFHPDYKYTDHQATPESTLKMAQDIGRKAGLTYIYAGNVIGWGSDTVCPSCKKTLIKRDIFNILEYNLKENKCGYCGYVIPGIFKDAH